MLSNGAGHPLLPLTIGGQFVASNYFKARLLPRWWGASPAMGGVGGATTAHGGKAGYFQGAGLFLHGPSSISYVQFLGHSDTVSISESSMTVILPGDRGSQASRGSFQFFSSYFDRLGEGAFSSPMTMPSEGHVVASFVSLVSFFVFDSSVDGADRVWGALLRGVLFFGGVVSDESGTEVGSSLGPYFWSRCMIPAGRKSGAFLQFLRGSQTRQEFPLFSSRDFCLVWVPFLPT